MQLYCSTGSLMLRKLIQNWLLTLSWARLHTPILMAIELKTVVLHLCEIGEFSFKTFSEKPSGRLCFTYTAEEGLHLQCTMPKEAGQLLLADIYGTSFARSLAN